MRLVALVALALAFAAPASAQADQSKLDAMASLVAGHPVRVDCVRDADAWGRGPAPGALGYAYDHEPGAIHLSPYACLVLDVPGSPLFGGGLHILAHEAAHARGIHDEGCAEVWALAWVADLGRRFYGVPFFSPRSIALQAASASIHRMTPAEYQTGKC
jgi:hypothetical protein